MSWEEKVTMIHVKYEVYKTEVIDVVCVLLDNF